MIINVPYQLKLPDRFTYPPLNDEDFELWLSRNIKESELFTDRVYLPILWTSFYKMADFGKDKRQLSILQHYLDNDLDRNKKYWTVVQYDDGIINHLDGIDICVFSMAGLPMDYSLPLICKPYPYQTGSGKHRDIFCSFVGRVTHPVREDMIKYLRDEPMMKYYISTQHHNPVDYCLTLSRSVFSLCPRGYSKNSFRIQESLQMGAIPVWVCDDILPIHNLDFTEYGVVVCERDVDKIPEILAAIPEDEIKTLQQNGKYVYEHYFTYEKNKELILKYLSDE